MGFKLLYVKPYFESTFDKVYVVIFQLISAIAFLVLGYSSLSAILYSFSKRTEPILSGGGSLLWILFALIIPFSIAILLFISAMINGGKPVSKK